MALVLMSRRSERAALPLSSLGDLRAARRRSRTLWLALAALLLLCPLAVAQTTRTSTAGEQILPVGSTAMIVLDLSSSTTRYFTQISSTLDQLTRENNRSLGLVVVSDSAYVALPPSTPVQGVRSWLSVFLRSPFLDYPWTDSFSKGTVLSRGLIEARTALRRAQVKNPQVVFITDLSDDPFDLRRLSAIVATYQREGIKLRIVSLGKGTDPSQQEPNWHNAAYITGGAHTTLSAPSQAAFGPVPPSLLVPAILLAALALFAAVYERMFHPLRWGTRA
jgi:hypothetical protein